MSRFVALTRAVPASIGDCQLTHLARREPIEVALAEAQHRAYERVLERVGCRLVPVAREDALPDSVFVEDTAVVFDEFAVLTRPGAESRRAEVASVARALAPLRELFSIEAPGTVDGGDVLRVGSVVYVGASSRTNHDGIQQLARLIESRGYSVTEISVVKCLHLKSAVTQVGERTLLVNPYWVNREHFADFDLVMVDPNEPSGANALRIGEAVLYDEAHPSTRARLERAGIAVHPVNLGELAKAEGAVTCCSLILRTHGAV
jgi:dimethylargininase